MKSSRFQLYSLGMRSTGAAEGIDENFFFLNKFYVGLV